MQMLVLDAVGATGALCGGDAMQRGRIFGRNPAVKGPICMAGTHRTLSAGGSGGYNGSM